MPANFYRFLQFETDLDGIWMDPKKNSYACEKKIKIKKDTFQSNVIYRGDQGLLAQEALRSVYVLTAKEIMGKLPRDISFIT